MVKQVERLYRSREDRIIAGVCGGLGEYFKIDPVLFRILFVLLALINGIGFLLYIALIFIIPLRGNSKKSTKKSDEGFDKKINQAADSFSEEVQEFVAKVSGNKKLNNTKNIFAIILIVFGFLALFSQVAPLPWLGFNLLFPALIVLLGLYIIFRR